MCTGDKVLSRAQKSAEKFLGFGIQKKVELSTNSLKKRKDRVQRTLKVASLENLNFPSKLSTPQTCEDRRT